MFRSSRAAAGSCVPPPPSWDLPSERFLCGQDLGSVLPSEAGCGQGALLFGLGLVGEERHLAVLSS